MKRRRRSKSQQTAQLRKTQLWRMGPPYPVPAALAQAMGSDKNLHSWAMDIGMAVLTRLIDTGTRPRGDVEELPVPLSSPAPPTLPRAKPGRQEVAPDVCIGDLLLDKYRIESVIGVGGMGLVVAAEHIHLKKRVALKLLRHEAGQNRESLGRFIREAQLVAKIESPHVARVFDMGTLESGIPYMVMEYLEGKDLFAWMQERGPLPVAQAVEIILQACEGIDEAHRLGIVHRDLKPANLFCVPSPDGAVDVKVLDFGISKVVDASSDEASSPLTQCHVLLGSPPYMSPEQLWCTRDVDFGTDIWSLGVILYEMLTGVLPFRGRNDHDLRNCVTTHSPPSLRRLRPDVSPEVEQVVLQCLAKEPGHRYPSAAHLAEGLRRCTSPRMPSGVSSSERASRSSAGIFLMAAVLALFVSGGRLAERPRIEPLAGPPAQARPAEPDGIVVRDVASPVPPGGSRSDSAQQPRGSQNAGDEDGDHSIRSSDLLPRGPRFTVTDEQCTVGAGGQVSASEPRGHGQWSHASGLQVPLGQSERLQRHARVAPL